MQLSQVFLELGEERLTQLLRSISIGKLRTFQLFDRMKARLHLSKLNSESLRKCAPRLLKRIQENDEELVTELGQAILVCHLDMIKAVLDELGIPHEDGFFNKDIDSTTYLVDGWQARVFQRFEGVYPEALLLFYINHLGVEMGKSETIFLPTALTSHEQ